MAKRTALGGSRGESMKILIINPGDRNFGSGNRTTALRWAHCFRQLGHSVRLAHRLSDTAPDLLVVLHACKSAVALTDFKKRWPDRPAVLALTGTDIYSAAPTDRAVMQHSIGLADRLVALQPKAADSLGAESKAKTRVVRQSASPVAPRAGLDPNCFLVVVAANLRDIKDPLRAAAAARLLHDTSKIKVVHLGRALSTVWAERAEYEEHVNARYRWLGECTRRATLEMISRSQLLVISSQAEGGANVLSEAVVSGVPVLSTRIDGSVGLLGDNYPGYFEVGDTAGLARLLDKAETDRGYYEALCQHIGQLKELFSPVRERACWEELIAELSLPQSRPPREAG